MFHLAEAGPDRWTILNTLAEVKQAGLAHSRAKVLIFQLLVANILGPLALSCRQVRHLNEIFLSEQVIQLSHLLM